MAHVLDLTNRPRKLEVQWDTEPHKNMDPNPESIIVDLYETFKNGEKESTEVVITKGDKWHIKVSGEEARSIVSALAKKGITAE